MSAAPAADAAAVSERLAQVRARIVSAGGDPAAVRIVAVTKGFDVSAVAAARSAGLTDIGENYGAELVDKAAALDLCDSSSPGGPASPVRWHFLGAVQRRKVRDLAPVVDCWQSVWRRSEGEAIAGHRPGATVLVEVDVAGIAERPGVSWGEAPALVDALRGLELDVRGLMAVAPLGAAEAARPSFRQLAQLAEDLGLAEVSMGMTDDLEVAVSEGATMVRVGRALFGPRPSAVP